MAKVWKPGQIVTIDGKKYRLKRSLTGPIVCRKCAACHIMHMSDEPCNTCLNNRKMPPYHYFEEIKPKSVMG